MALSFNRGSLFVYSFYPKLVLVAQAKSEGSGWLRTRRRIQVEILAPPKQALKGKQTSTCSIKNWPGPKDQKRQIHFKDPMQFKNIDTKSSKDKENGLRTASFGQINL
jgi:hypothetical protein